MPIIRASITIQVGATHPPVCPPMHGPIVCLPSRAPILSTHRSVRQSSACLRSCTGTHKSKWVIRVFGGPVPETQVLTHSKTRVLQQLWAHLLAYMSIHISIHVSFVCTNVYMHVYISMHKSVHISTRMSEFKYIHPPTRMP